MQEGKRRLYMGAATVRGPRACNWNLLETCDALCNSVANGVQSSGICEWLCPFRQILRILMEAFSSSGTSTHSKQRRGYSGACTVAHGCFLQLRKVAQLHVKATHSCAQLTSTLYQSFFIKSGAGEIMFEGTMYCKRPPPPPSELTHVTARATAHFPMPPPPSMSWWRGRHR